MNRYAQRVEELTDSYCKESNSKRLKTMTEEELQVVEREIGHVLPPDFREFLRDFGGISFSDNQCRRAALHLLSAYQWGKASIGSAFDDTRLIETWKSSRGYVPDELLLFGEDGNVQLFVAVDGEHVGSIYQFYPSYFPENLYYYPELELIARSFDSFINSLEILPGDEIIEYEQERQDTRRRVEELTLAVPHADNIYKEILLSVKGRYVYATLSEDSAVLSKSDFDELEKEIGFSFPQDYKDFITHCGGYSFLPGLGYGDNYQPFSTYPNISNEKANEINRAKGYYEVINFFHGYMPKDYHDLMGHYQRLKSFLPVGFLPIADAGEICLILDGVNRGCVCKAPREVIEFSLCPSYGGPSTRLDLDSFGFLAPSFDDFVRSLRSDLSPGSWIE